MEPTYYRTFWSCPEMQSRIAGGIQQNRMSEITLKFCDEKNLPHPGLQVTVEQTKSDFRFGANCFMLGAYPDDAANAAYEAAFAWLFNSATVPFYWKGLEPEKGKPRFSKGSISVPRRPPPDLVVEFCERNGIAPHGHTLVWDLVQWSIPDWLPEDPEACKPLWQERVKEIAALYGSKIPRWDVLNEYVTGTPRHPRSRAMPENYDLLAFQWASQFFPPQSELWYNEVTECWTELRESALAEIRRLRDHQTHLSGFGLQFHLFKESDVHAVLEGLKFRPLEMLAALDAFSQYGLPVHVSEITLPATGSTPEAEELQAEMAVNFYRLWFSHPSVAAITWWNLPDGGAAEGEGGVQSGLLRSDLSPKPAYQALKDLIHREWRTKIQTETNKDGLISFRGFHGTYRISTALGSATEHHFGAGGPHIEDFCQPA